MSGTIIRPVQPTSETAIPQVTHLRWLNRAYRVTSYADASATVLHTVSIWPNAVALDTPLLCGIDGSVLGWVDSRGRCYLGPLHAANAVEAYAPTWIEMP